MGQTRPTNPIIQVLGLVAGMIFFIGAALLGGIVLAAIMGFLLVAGLVIYVRVWWMMRKAGRRQRNDAFVDAEYKVIDTSKRDGDRR